MKVGSDTCVIRSSNINYGDVFNIGIRCINACTFNFRAFYSSVVRLKENETSQVRLDGSSSNIFEYFIPSDTIDGAT